MTKITKAQLAEENASLRSEVARLQNQLEAERAQHSDDIAQLVQDKIDKSNAEIDRASERRVFRAHARERGRSDFHSLPPHMQAAKDMAMRIGRTVKVG